jgi:hypothetical protein
MEIIDIGLNDLAPISINFNDSEPSSSSSSAGKSVNFGPGIELLMNDKKRASNGINIDLGDLDNLENELNALSGVKPMNIPEPVESKTIGGLGSSFGNFFGFGKEPIKSVNLEPSDSGLGQATAESANNTSKTWDGFTKIGAEIPKSASASSSSANMTERERRRKKRMMIKKLEEWYEKGTIKNTSRFTMDSN